MGKRRVIKIKNSDCADLNEMQRNYKGLRRTLKMTTSKTKYGFLVMTKTHTYKLGV